MENTNNETIDTNNETIDNNEIKPKKVNYEARRKATRAFYERNKDNEEFKKKHRENAKKAYEKDKERIIARVRANQRRNQELEQLERLYELKEQGLITFEKLSLNDNKVLLNNLEILGM